MIANMTKSTTEKYESLNSFFLSPDRTQYRRILVRAQVIIEFNTVVASSLAKDNGCNMAFYIEQDWDRKTIIRKV